MKMNERERKTAVACMEFLARCINDEDIFFEFWLTCGVADGDINYNELLTNTDKTIDSIDDYYIEKENFADLMKVFLICMSHAKKSGGLYCDNVTSD